MRNLTIIVLGVMALMIAGVAVQVPDAGAISAPIHITQDVNMRAGTSASSTRVGGIHAGESPDYNCWAKGDDVNGVDVWFNVNSGGVTGYYASYFDDSHYPTDDDINGLYNIPRCGADAATPPATPPATPVSMYFSPYPSGSHTLNDGSVKSLARGQWWSSGCAPSAGSVARSTARGHPVTTLAGWSLGRVGVIRYLAAASDDELRQLGYVLLIDPGNYDDLTCDRQLDAGGVLAKWLSVNQSAHLVVVSGSKVSQQDHSRGIQESYFNEIRNQSSAPRPNLRPRVLTCNYAVDHQQAFATAQYWIQHQIGTTSCPTLRTSSASFAPSATWHP